MSSTRTPQSVSTCDRSPIQRSVRPNIFEPNLFCNKCELVATSNSCPFPPTFGPLRPNRQAIQLPWAKEWAFPLKDSTSLPSQIPSRPWTPYAGSFSASIRRLTRCPLAWGSTLWQASAGTFCSWPRFNSCSTLGSGAERLHPKPHAGYNASHKFTSQGFLLYRQTLLNRQVPFLQRLITACLCAIGLLLGLAYVTLSGFVTLFTCIILLGFVGSIGYDLLSHTWFWACSIHKRFVEFNEQVCRSLSPISPSLEISCTSGADESGSNSGSSASRIPCKHFRYDSVVLDTLLDLYVSSLRVLYSVSPASSLLWHYSDHLQFLHDFRHYLYDYPPPKPVASHDYAFLQDTVRSPCQILLLAVLERMTSDRVKQLIQNRWVQKQPKLRSITLHKWTRNCWYPLRISRGPCHVPYRSQEGLDAASKYFQISNHVSECAIDLKQVTIYEALSELASCCLRRDLPLWRAVLFQPSNDDVVVRIRQHFTRTSEDCVNSSDSSDEGIVEQAKNISFLALQIHHSIADGIGVASSLMQDLFDNVSNKSVGFGSDLLAVRPPPLLSNALGKALLFGYYFVTSFCKVLRILAFWSFWAPEPPALLQEPGTKLLASRPKANGRKYLAPPMVFEIAEVRHLCRLVERSIGVRPTVNDIFAHCVTVAFDRLRHGAVLEEVRLHLTNKLHEKHQRFSSSIRRLTEESPTQAQPPRRHRSSTGSFGGGDTGGEPRAAEDATSECAELSYTPYERQLAIPRNAYYHRFATDFEHYLALMIPMSCRMQMPSELNNFTAFVITRLPLTTGTLKQFKRDAQFERTVCGLQSALSSREAKCDAKCATSKAAESLRLRLRHLVAVKGELDWLKQSQSRFQHFTVVCAMFKALPDIVTRLWTKTLNRGLQLYFTNVPGPSERCALGGKQILSLQAWPPVRGDVSTAVMLLGYCGDLQFLVAVDEAELLRPFSEKDREVLSKRDLLTLTTMIGELVWEEFQSLLEQLTLVRCRTEE
eukprot:Gregarina_sp_Poly_1__1301@NODE_131_length_13241_cov_228_075983_g117_i0_p2_GENE_NODE_131_length_13241_cov_228_075983_g117_i0NODE_131_length_13241_cov_228_075983_g117_i0_p2_ORF_typecomplete_len992_score122_12DUF1298/PF06974_13/1_1e14WES_acyltransf/PF03007_16/4_5e03WES_acyltransf/PF03007_16/3_5e06WES_acyltransf/PF03007_16/4_9e03AATase/PF07247_12/1_4AATase/PF07247_12/1_6e02_NODE_131_length_13241_cov_228_075983_g117_i012454220